MCFYICSQAAKPGHGWSQAVKAGRQEEIWSPGYQPINQTKNLFVIRSKDQTGLCTHQPTPTQAHAHTTHQEHTHAHSHKHTPQAHTYHAKPHNQRLRIIEKYTRLEIFNKLQLSKI